MVKIAAPDAVLDPFLIWAKHRWNPNRGGTVLTEKQIQIAQTLLNYQTVFINEERQAGVTTIMLLVAKYWTETNRLPALYVNTHRGLAHAKQTYSTMREPRTEDINFEVFARASGGARFSAVVIDDIDMIPDQDVDTFFNIVYHSICFPRGKGDRNPKKVPVWISGRDVQFRPDGLGKTMWNNLKELANPDLVPVDVESWRHEY